MIFSSYLEINYDDSFLENPIPIDHSFNIPLEITYSTDIPETFGRFLPWQIRNIILFGSMIGPMQKIHVEVIDTPAWADIHFTQPDLFVSIPFENEPQSGLTTLVISLRDDAPASPQSINIQASCQALGRIQPRVFNKPLSFTPQYLPLLSISMENNVITTPPNTIVQIPFEVTNKGNKLSSVYYELAGELDGWFYGWAPPILVINSDETEIVTLILEAPDEFEGDEIVFVDFFTRRFPFQGEDPWSGPFSMYFIVEYSEES